MKLGFNCKRKKEKTNKQLLSHYCSNQDDEMAENILLSIGDSVVTTDVEGRIQFLNPGAEIMTGWTKEEAIGRPFNEVVNFFNDAIQENYPDLVETCLKVGSTIHIPDNTPLVNRNGKRIIVRDSVSPIRDKNGDVHGIVFVITDMTESYKLTQKLAYQAMHDPLTGLTNRREFDKRLERVFNSSQLGYSTSVLCYIDIDKFKTINDTAGHQAGDKLLRQLVAKFRQYIRQRDTLARIGGDEFGLLMQHCTLKQGLLIANKLRAVADNFYFSWEGKKFDISVSIGLVEMTKASDSVSSIVKAVDKACYAAKNAGRNQVSIINDTANLDKDNAEIQLISLINNCLEKDRFILTRQKIVAIDQNNKGDHFEILLRLKDGDDNLVLPGNFMPVAEQFGLSTQIDQWVVNKTFEMLNNYPRPLDQLYLCHINLSAHSLSGSKFLTWLVSKINQVKFPPEKICFELTETAAMTNLTEATEFIKILKGKGVKFALDDFGSGFCSYGYLKQLPVDFVKIDGTFVEEIAKDSAALAVIKSMNEVSHLLGKQTIAEFVKDQPTMDKLKDIGVEFAQGYLFGRPEPTWLENRAVNAVSSAMEVASIPL